MAIAAPIRIAAKTVDRGIPDVYVKLLGYLLGDGGTTVAVRFSQKEGRTLEEFREIVESLGCRLTKANSTYDFNVVGSDNGNQLEPGRNAVLNLSREWGLHGCRSKEKRFPAWVWTLPDRQLALLLNRFLACDGWAYSYERNKRQGAQIGCSLASEGLIRDIEIAMLRLGIPGRVRFRVVKINGNPHNAWEWAISRHHLIARFADVVGIFGKEDDVRACVEQTRLRNPKRTQKWRWNNIPDGYEWERIVRIEPLGERPTVSIEVQHYHTFVSTLVEHNTLCAAALVLWRGCCFADSVVITTATKFDQSALSIWREINLLASRAPIELGCTVMTTMIRWKNGSVAFAMTAPENSTDKFLGIRGKDTFIIVDEAPGVSEAIFTGIVSILTGTSTRLLLLGNPTDANCAFARAFKSTGYYKITLNAFDSPNVQPFGITEADIVSGAWKDKTPPLDRLPVPGVTHAFWIRERWEEWTDFGARPNDPRWVARVRAEFPEESDDTLIPMAWFDAACALGRRDPDPSWAVEPKENGIDVAWEGEDSDESTIMGRRGIFARCLQVIARADTMRVADFGVEHHQKTGAACSKVDVIGVGAGTYDNMKRRVKTKPVNVSLPARNTERYVNLRAEGFDNLRTRFRDSYRALHGEKDPETGAAITPGIVLEDRDEKLGTELNAMKWLPPDERGRMRLEPKRKTKARLGRSPDRADGLMLAFIQPKPEVVMV